ncbi:hypothetical protein ACA910_002404 [Epithemia clementina (nom. ined.)]
MVGYLAAVSFVFLVGVDNIITASPGILNRRNRTERQQSRRHTTTGGNFLRSAFSYRRTCEPSFHHYNFSVRNGCFIHPSHERPHCQFQNLQINLSAVSSVRLGGESLTMSAHDERSSKKQGNHRDDQILGQPGSYEILNYGPRTFLFSQPPSPFLNLDDDGPDSNLSFFFSRPPSLHYINDIFLHGKVQSLTMPSCQEDDENRITVKGLTLLVARESYANFYHAMQLWWNTYFTINADDEAGLNAFGSPINLIFLDAHPHTSLDTIWSDLYAPVTYLQRDFHFRDKSPITNKILCLEHVRLIPPGTNAPFTVAGKNSAKFINHCPSQSMTRRFVDYVLDKYNLTDVGQVPGRVVVIDRLPYLAHPRSDADTIDRQIPGLASAAKAVLENTLSRSELSLEVVALENLPMKEQLRTILRAQVLVGNHGAGLTHLLFLKKNAHVLEMSCRRLFFRRLTEWSSNQPIHHHCLKPVQYNQTFPSASQPLAEYLQNEVVPIIKEIFEPKES